VSDATYYKLFENPDGASGFPQLGADIVGPAVSTPIDIGAGAVRIYTRSGGTWTPQTYVKASNSEAHDNFGHSVAVSGDGNTLAVGTPFEASNTTGVNNTSPGQGSNSAIDAGAVHLY